MGNARKFVLLATTLSLVWSGCVKDPQDIPPGLTENPEFGISGVFDGQPLEVEAGINEWTVQPVVTDADSILVYTSIFSKNGCTDECVPSWEFRFYADQTSSVNAEADFLQTVRTGRKDFVSSHQERDSFELTLHTNPGLFMSGFSSWENLNGSVTSMQEQFKDVVGYGEFLNVCFQSLAYTGCQYNQCIYFNPATLIPCIASIQARYEDAHTISATIKPESGTPPFHIEWFDSSEKPSILLYHEESKAEFLINVQVTDALGNKSELTQSIRLQDSIIDQCFFPISLESISVPNNSPVLLSDRVEIKYTDENGIEWNSTSGIQPVSSFMNISEVSYFDLSPAQQRSYKTSLSLSVKLYNAAGESKLLESQGMTIALSHR